MTVSVSPAALVRLIGPWRRQGLPAYRALAEALKALVMDGRLAVGVGLPGERSVAGPLGVSRTTVSAAYDLLGADGFARKRPRSQTVTALPHAASRGAATWPAPAVDDELDFASAAPPADPAVGGAYARALSALPEFLPTSGYDLRGCLPLREAVARRYRAHGFPTVAAEILVTHGALDALRRLLRALVRPRARVLIDHPTYPPAIDAILESGGRPLPAPLTEAGWDVDLMTHLLRTERPVLAYLILDHHNPTGRVMGVQDRRQLITAAEEAGTVLVVDETLRDLGLEGPAPSGTGEADPPCVVRLGSTSKTFWGGLRIGWIRAGRDVMAMLTEGRTSVDFGAPVLEQLAAAILLEDGASVLAERLALIRERRDYLAGVVSARMPGVRFERPGGGLSIWAEMEAPVANALAEACRKDGVRIAAGPRFGIGGVFDRFVRLPYTLPPSDMERALQTVARHYWHLLQGRASSRRRSSGGLIY